MFAEKRRELFREVTIQRADQRAEDAGVSVYCPLTQPRHVVVQLTIAPRVQAKE